MESQQLSPSQAHALFDILTHHEAYAEIQALKDRKSIANFGVPLQPESPSASSSPLIETLLSRFILVLPGLRDVPPEFWTENIKGLATALDDANLSESYDKGSIGIRKTLSTAIASMVEYVSRGTLGGYPKATPGKDRQYDPSKPEDVITAWDDFLQQIVYGDLLDRLFSKAAETDQLSEHDSLVQAAHEYAVVILCSFLHYTLIVSPRGQSILPLLTRAHNMAPYFLVRQTLRVGNAASMLSGMVKLVLAKMNLSTVTSWFGGQASDSGMNLLQQIVSTVLGWDNNELKKRAGAIEKSKVAPSKDKLQILKAYCVKPAEEQHMHRTKSKSKRESIVSAILSESPKYESLSNEQHKIALDYLAIQLAIRDREELIRVFCRLSPDLLTSSIRSVIPAYDPIIRALHQAADLSGSVSDLESFLNDLIKIASVDGKNGKSTPPRVEDFCHLLHKHQGSSHRFIHQVVKNGKGLKQWYYEYAAHAAKQYRQEKTGEPENAKASETAAGDFTPQLKTLISKLSKEDRSEVIQEIDKHTEYLSVLTQNSITRMKAIILNLSETKAEISRGPGMFLSKWQTLMDESPITPATPEGTVRHGSDRSVIEATRVDTDGAKKGNMDAHEEAQDPDTHPPGVSNIVQFLIPGFQEILRSLDGK